MQNMFRIWSSISTQVNNSRVGGSVSGRWVSGKVVRGQWVREFLVGGFNKTL